MLIFGPEMSFFSVDPRLRKSERKWQTVHVIALGFILKFSLLSQCHYTGMTLITVARL